METGFYWVNLAEPSPYDGQDCRSGWQPAHYDASLGGGWTILGAYDYVPGPDNLPLEIGPRIPAYLPD